MMFMAAPFEGIYIDTLFIKDTNADAALMKIMINSRAGKSAYIWQWYMLSMIWRLAHDGCE